jgi:hypothetical protein
MQMHPELRKGLAEERIQRLAVDMWTPATAGRTRRLAAAVLLAASRRLAPEPAASRHASSASLTSLSASSLCSRRTAV